METFSCYYSLLLMLSVLITDGNCQGAVYTMSMSPTMNQVIVSRVSISTGQLMYVASVSTNGTGVNVTAADPLFSQGSIMVYENYLFVVNPGSNTLSQFSISPTDATQITLISVQPTNGTYPISVAVNSMYACVLNGGTLNGFRCFSYTSNGLTTMASYDRSLVLYVNQTTPPMGPPNTLSQIQFSADNQALIVSVKGVPNVFSGYILIYTINNGSLSLNPKETVPTGAVLPFSMTLVGQNGLLLTDPGANGFLTLSYSSSNGSVMNSLFTPVNTSVAAALCWSVYSSKTGNYYGIAAGTGTIVEISINPSTNNVTIVQYYMLPNQTGALDTTIITLGSTDYLYVIGTKAQVIISYKLNGPGNATLNGQLTLPASPQVGSPLVQGLAGYVQMSHSSMILRPMGIYQSLVLIFMIFFMQSFMFH